MIDFKLCATNDVLNSLVRLLNCLIE